MGRQDCKTWLCHTGANDRRSLPACENARLVDETRRTNPTTNPPPHDSYILLFKPLRCLPRSGLAVSDLREAGGRRRRREPFDELVELCSKGVGVLAGLWFGP